MPLLLIELLVLMAIGSGTILFVARMRLLASASQSHSTVPDADRYRPMLRLLSDADFDLVATNPFLRGKIRAKRRQIFRNYLRCLTKDYGQLLAGVRRIMVESHVERPDLTKALAKNRVFFALALCRIEFDLKLHALGIGKVDVSGLVEALDALRNTVGGMTPAAAGAGY